MKTNQEGVNLIKIFEGLHDGNLQKIGLQPKKCPAGIWTEGYGHAMRDAKGSFLKGATMPKPTISNEIEAEKLLQKDLLVYEVIVARNIKVVLNENQFSALVSYVYNTGGSNTLYKLINKQSSKKNIKDWIENKYISVGGVVLKGLINRRKSEASLYFKK